MSEKLWKDEVMRNRRRKKKSEAEVEKGVREQWPVKAKYANKNIELGLLFFRASSLNSIAGVSDSFLPGSPSASGLPSKGRM